MTEAERVRLVELADEAAADPHVWPVFLEVYAQALAADIAFLQVHYFNEYRSDVLASHGLAPKHREDYDRHYSRLNIWRDSGFHVFVQGRAVLDTELCPRDEFKRSEFYNDYLRFLDCSYSLDATISRNRTTAMNLTAMRSERKAPWNEDERKFSETLVPHLKRATTVQRRLAVLEAGEILLDQHEMGIVLLGTDRKVLYINKAAEVILRKRDGLALSGDTPVAIDRRANTRLQAAIGWALAKEQSIECPEAVRVPQPSMKSFYQVMVAPMRRRLPPFVGMPLPAVLILVVDPGNQRVASARLLQKVYSLTAKEAQVVRGLCDGKTLETIAGEMEITYETSRTHLKRVFSKTGTSRQAQLVAQILSLPWMLLTL